MEFDPLVIFAADKSLKEDKGFILDAIKINSVAKEILEKNEDVLLEDIKIDPMLMNYDKILKKIKILY